MRGEERGEVMKEMMHLLIIFIFKECLEFIDIK